MCDTGECDDVRIDVLHSLYAQANKKQTMQQGALYVGPNHKVKLAEMRQIK